MRHPRLILALAGLIAIAFVLRIYRLDAVPLRGDEAFAVRYWAANPVDVVHDLARQEPHPFGTFFGFWAWKSVAGDSVFAMRYLPLLGSLLGVAATAALAHRLTRSWQLGLSAAALWAINPYLIWHAQDVRNYALWASFSVLAMWLFVRATQRNTGRAWALYAAAELLALYTFFLEAFLLPVQLLYLWMHRPNRATRRSALRSWAIMGILLIPWFIQAGWLTTSDYSGTLSKAAPDRLLTWFVPTLFTGAEPAAPWNTLLPMIGIAALVVALVPWWRQDRSLVGWLAAYILLPTAILALAATRMSVFHPRYLLAISPALLILLALAITLPARSTRPTQTWIAARATILLIPLLGIMQLGSYYQGENAKSPDWPHLAQYLEASAAPDDIILHTVPDPAFNYYYDGATPETSLTAGQPLTGQLAALTQNHRTIWFVGNRADVQSALSDTYQQLSQQQIGTFTVTQYRDPHVAPAEIVLPQDVSFDGIARLAGVTLQGPDPITHHLTVLLYWEPLRQAETGYTVFVHLIGPFHGPDNTPLWSQDDHPPQYGAASTTHWTPGELLRDPYTLDLSTVPDGPYTLNIGLYDPANPAERLAITNSDSTSQGDSFPIEITLPRAP